MVAGNVFQGDEIFRSTLSELERGLTVALIATRNVLSLDARTPSAIAENQMAEHDISQIPVKENGKVVGVYLQHSAGSAEYIGQRLQPIDDSLLVSMNAALLDLIHDLAGGGPDYRLVIGQRGIEGIVTKSDLQKLPVRLLTYSLVTHLESVMANLIQRRCPEEDEWLEHLSLGMAELFPNWDTTSPQDLRAKFKGLQYGMRKGGVAPDLLDLTDFRHKYVILWRALPLDPEFADDMRKVNKWLRNTVAHSRSLPATAQHLRRLSQDLRATQDWTEKLAKMLAETSAIPGATPALHTPAPTM